MSLITHLSSLAQLRTLLDAKKDKLVVIDFHATWCGPCHAIAPKYEQLSQQYKGVATFCKVDVDAAKDIAAEYSVRAMPTFVFVKGGAKVDEVKGANAKAIEAALMKHAGAGAAVSSFPGSGHTLAGQTVAPPGASSQLPDFKTLFILIALVGLWWYYGKDGKVDLPPDGEGFF